MEELTRENEDLVLEFHGLLWGVCCVDDMFPPDSPPPTAAGVREPRRPIPPYLPLAQQLLLSETELVLTNIDLALLAA